MKASLRSVRIAPKKAQLVAKMVRGMPVLTAIASLERTNKKAARILEDLLRSAVANAQSNEKQSPDVLTVESLVVNKAQSLRRGVPMARGRIRPMRKFLSHIHVTLGIEGIAPATPAKKEVKKAEAEKKTTVSTSQTKATPVKKAKASSTATKKSPKSTSSAKKDTASSRSGSAAKKPATKKTTN